MNSLDKKEQFTYMLSGKRQPVLIVPIKTIPIDYQTPKKTEINWNKIIHGSIMCGIVCGIAFCAIYQYINKPTIGVTILSVGLFVCYIIVGLFFLKG